MLHAYQQENTVFRFSRYMDSESCPIPLLPVLHVAMPCIRRTIPTYIQVDLGTASLVPTLCRTLISWQRTSTSCLCDHYFTKCLVLRERKDMMKQQHAESIIFVENARRQTAKYIEILRLCLHP